MIRSFLHELKAAQARTGSCARALCAGLPGSTIRRWQQRQRDDKSLLDTPGPKKNRTPDWPLILAQVKSLDHGRRRTHDTTALYQEHRDEVSRRQCQQLVQEERDRQLDHMKRIHWLRPGTAWSIDATHYQGSQLVPLHDLASRYRFAPLVCSREDGSQIAAFLDHAFRQNGAPLLLKRDNGSPFNCEQVNAVLAQHGVLPLNSPPHYPRYNGAMEKSIGDFKRRLSSRLITPAEDRLLAAAPAPGSQNPPPDFAVAGGTVLPECPTHGCGRSTRPRHRLAGHRAILACPPGPHLRRPPTKTKPNSVNHFSQKMVS